MAHRSTLVARQLFSIFCLLFFFLCPQDALATAVYLKSGKVMTGKIVEKNDRFIVLKAGAGRDIVRTTIFHEDILRIESEEEYAQEVALIPFKIFRLEPKRLEIEEPFFKRVEPSEDAAVNIQKLIQQDASLKAQVEELPEGATLFWTDPGEKISDTAKMKTRKASFKQPPHAQKANAAHPFSNDLEVLDFYYRRISRQDEAFFLVVRNKGQESVPLVYIDTEINGEAFGDNQVKIEQLNPGEEREIDIVRLYRSYLSWHAMKHPESAPDTALRFRFSRPDTGEVLLEKVIVVFS